MDSPPAKPDTTSTRSIARSAGTVAAAFVVSQVIGLLANSLIGSTFGAGAENDAYFAANRFAETLFNLVAGGALGSAFIPTFTGLLVNERRKDAWRLAAGVANLVLIALAALSLMAAALAPQIVRYLLAPGFSADPAKLQLTIDLLRIQLPSVALFAISGLVMGILNAHRRFLLPALTPAMYSLGKIFGLLVLGQTMGVYGLAWGVVIGAALHLLLQLPSLVRLPLASYTPALGLDNPAVREVFRLMGPRLLGVAVVQLNFWLNTTLASLHSEGSLTGLNLAFPLMYMPEAAIAQSIAIAALPAFSALAAQGRMVEMRSSLAGILRLVLLLSLPASVGLILLREPVVALVYGYNNFDQVSLQLASWALLWYAAGLVGHSVVEITSRAFYALHDTRTPVIVGVIAMSLNIAFSLAFTALFTRLGWMPHGGLALANSLATFLEMIGLLVLMRRRLGGLEGRAMARSLAQAALAAGLMGIVVALIARLLNANLALAALAGAAAGGAVYAIALLALGVRELRAAIKLVLNKLGLPFFSPR